MRSNNIALPSPRYIRRGSCKNCGMCCANEDCDSLVVSNGRSTCLIHPSITGKEGRPSKCPSYPQAPPIIYKSCGYYFYDTWNNKIVRPGEI
jgi:hypothetical protein